MHDLCNCWAYAWSLHPDGAGFSQLWRHTRALLSEMQHRPIVHLPTNLCVRCWLVMPLLLWLHQCCNIDWFLGALDVACLLCGASRWPHVVKQTGTRWPCFTDVVQCVRCVCPLCALPCLQLQLYLPHACGVLPCHKLHQEAVDTHATPYLACYACTPHASGWQFPGKDDVCSRSGLFLLAKHGVLSVCLGARNLWLACLQKCT